MITSVLRVAAHQTAAKGTFQGAVKGPNPTHG